MEALIFAATLVTVLSLLLPLSLSLFQFVSVQI